MSAGRDRHGELQWRFQLTHRAILHMTEDGDWSWHSVTRNTRLKIEPLLLEAQALAAALVGWLESADVQPPEPIAWNAKARRLAWEVGPTGGAASR